MTHAITDLEYDLAIRELPEGWNARGAELVSTAWLTEVRFLHSAIAVTALLTTISL